MSDDPRHDERVSPEVRREAARRDHRVKVALLAVSVLTIAVLAAAAVRENLAAPWRLHQIRFASILEEKATDDWGKTLADRFEVRMRQIVVPELGAIDRCVSCHAGYDDPRMTDVPEPYRVHPGPYLSWHEDARFGCTVCHRGQGAATTFEDAKAEDRHWDYPLLPTDLTQSSCGVCHTPAEVAGRGGEIYARGAALFESKGCRSCHKLHGVGGAVGPGLDNEGLKVKGQLPMAGIEGPHTLPQWLEEHFRNPQAVVTGSAMPTPGLNEDEITALTTFLLSLQARDLPQSYLSPEKHLDLYRRAHPEPVPPDILYVELCARCHDTGRFGRYDKFYGRFMPAVRGPSFRENADPAFVAAVIRRGRPGTLMPAWGPEAGGLSEADIRGLTEYLLGRPVTATETDPGAAPRARPALGGDAKAGYPVFRKTCSGCHGEDGGGRLGPSLANPVFQAQASPDFIYRTIAQGRADTAMPAFLAPGAGGLTEDQIRNVVAYVRTLGQETDPGAMAAAEAAPDGATPNPNREGDVHE